MEGEFRWPVRVYYEDTDTGGVVYYANYLKFFERARTEWLRSAALTQQSLIENEQVMFVVKSASIDYHAPAKLDDQLEISVNVEKLGKATVNFSQQTWRHADDALELLCTANIRVGCVHAVTFRPVPMPATMLEKINNLHTRSGSVHHTASTNYPNLLTPP
jgi:acyl-CoA thioester hydrolase